MFNPVTLTPLGADVDGQERVDDREKKQELFILLSLVVFYLKLILVVEYAMCKSMYVISARYLERIFANGCFQGWVMDDGEKCLLLLIGLSLLSNVSHG